MLLRGGSKFCMELFSNKGDLFHDALGYHFNLCKLRLRHIDCFFSRCKFEFH